MKKKVLFAATAVTVLSACAGTAREETTSARPPNIIYILCDDLGIGELGCYGQEKIATPNIDRLRAEGMKFTAHYSGSTVCAPSRCALLTGLHTGHTPIRGNKEIKPEGQHPIPPETLTIAEVLKTRGYATACVGKWGLGNMESVGSPLRQGFDHFYGYNCQRHAHSYYPSYLWNDTARITINNGVDIAGHQRLPKGSDPNKPESYNRFIGKEFSPDLMNADALRWMRENKGRPFFLYYATPLPHVALQAPENEVAVYRDKFDDKPYLGGGGYLPNRYPRATYAAMVSCIDRYVGDIMAEVKRLGLDDNTVIMFCSDNGPTFNGGTQSAYFNSAQGRRGLKCDLHEGGIRTPFIARWPGHIAAASESGHLSAMWDFFPTACEIAGAPLPQNLDGISLLPTLTDKGTQRAHDYLYWEDAGALQAIRCGDWKAVRFHPSKKIQLFNLKDDPKETTDLAKTQPEKTAELLKRMSEVRTENPVFPLKTK